MECEEFNDSQDDHSEVPSGLLCSEASSLSDRVINLLGDALEEHRMAVTHKLGLSSGSPLSEALYEWCQLPGSTVFVLRAVLVDIGRRDLAEGLVNELMTSMSLYIVVEDVDLTTNKVRRQFFTVTTHCDVTLASALENLLHVSRYRIIGPEDWVSWSTSARALKGRQLTLQYMASKTDKAIYGYNSNNGNTMDVKGQTYKAPVKGLSELKGLHLHTIGVEGCSLEEEKIPRLRRARTMPTFVPAYNIPPGDHETNMHAIQDLKQPIISPALSSESVSNNMVPMNTLNTQSSSPSTPVACQGSSSYQGMSLTFSTFDDQLTIDSTDVKVPVGKKTPSQHGSTKNYADVTDSSHLNKDCSSMTELKTRKEIDTGQMMVTHGSNKPEMVKTTELSQRSLSNNNLQASDQLMEQNQLSGPSLYKEPPKDTYYHKTHMQQLATAPIMFTHEKNDSYMNTNVKSVPTFEDKDVGFKEVNESMDTSSDDGSIPIGGGNSMNNDLNLSSSIDLARRNNGDLESDSASNIHTPYSAIISPLSAHDGSHELVTDSLNEDSSAIQSAPGSNANNIEDKIESCNRIPIASPALCPNVPNGTRRAIQEQDRKMREITSHSCQVSHRPDQDEKMNFMSSKSSPFVHTPPPPIYYQDIPPPNYLDVTPFPGPELFPCPLPQRHNCHPQHCHQRCNCNISPSHSQPIAQITYPNPMHTPAVPMQVPPRSLPARTMGYTSNGRGRDIAVQTPPMRRHVPPFSGHVSSVSEPIMHHESRPQVFSYGEVGGQNVEYLTPVDEEEGRHQTIMHRGFQPMSQIVASQPRRHIFQGPFVDEEDYSYIEPGFLPQSGHRQSDLQIPNRAPPPPPRPQMSLEDQLAKVKGWCPAATDATIERTMRDFRSENGYYIVWKSQEKNRFVISVSHKHELHHFLIEQRMLEPNSNRCLYYIYKGGFSSESLLELVNHYITWGVKQRLNDSPIGTKAYACEHIPLRRPLKMRKSFSVDS